MGVGGVRQYWIHKQCAYFHSFMSTKYTLRVDDQTCVASMSWIRLKIVRSYRSADKMYCFSTCQDNGDIYYPLAISSVICFASDCAGLRKYERMRAHSVF